MTYRHKRNKLYKQRRRTKYTVLRTLIEANVSDLYFYKIEETISTEKSISVHSLQFKYKSRNLVRIFCSTMAIQGLSDQECTSKVLKRMALYRIKELAKEELEAFLKPKVRNLESETRYKEKQMEKLTFRERAYRHMTFPPENTVLHFQERKALSDDEKKAIRQQTRELIRNEHVQAAHRIKVLQSLHGINTCSFVLTVGQLDVAEHHTGEHKTNEYTAEEIINRYRHGLSVPEEFIETLNDMAFLLDYESSEDSLVMRRKHYTFKPNGPLDETTESDHEDDTQLLQKIFSSRISVSSSDYCYSSASNPEFFDSDDEWQYHAEKYREESENSVLPSLEIDENDSPSAIVLNPMGTDDVGDKIPAWPAKDINCFKMRIENIYCLDYFHTWLYGEVRDQTLDKDVLMIDAYPEIFEAYKKKWNNWPEDRQHYIDRFRSGEMMKTNRNHIIKNNLMVRLLECDDLKSSYDFEDFDTDAYVQGKIQ